MASGGGPAARVPPQAHLAAHRLVILLSLLLFVSCSFPGAVRPTLKIGLVAPFEGRYRAVGYDVIYAARLALHEVNGAGGVAGYSIELVAFDDAADVAMAVEQAHKLSVDPDVVAAIGHFREETTRASTEAYAQAGLPLVAPGLLGPIQNPDRGAVFRLGPSADTLANAMIGRASQLVEESRDDPRTGGEVLLVDQGAPLGAALRVLASERAAATTGWRFTEVSIEGRSWRQDVLASDPLVLLCDLDPVAAGEVVSELHQGGWSGQVVGGPALAAPEFVAVAGWAAQGASFVTPWPFPADVPGGEHFAAAYRETSNGLEPGPMALAAYEATWMVLETLEPVLSRGQPTRARLSEALIGAEREGLPGLVGFDERDDWASESLYWYHIGPQGVPSL